MENNLQVVDISSIELVHGNIGRRKYKSIKENEKICAKCRKSRPLNEYSSDISRVDGKNYWCKNCENVIGRNYYVKVTGRTVDQLRSYSSLGIVDGRRLCPKCKKWKLISWFLYNAHCKECAYKGSRAHNYKESLRIKLICVLGYGGKCSCCGDSRIEMLTLEHIRHRGHELIEGTTITVMKKLIELSFPKEYTILCAGCNQLTRHGKPCVHTEEWKKYYTENIVPYKYGKQVELNELLKRHKMKMEG